MSELKINATFAQKYDKYRQREELQRLKDRYGDPAEDSGSDSSQSSSDDSEVELDPEIEKDFYRTLSLLKKKDPRIYEKDATFYTKEKSSSEDKPSSSRAAVTPMFLKDYERKVIVERAGKYEDEEDSDGEEAAQRRERAASPTYVQEQRELRESFHRFVQDSDDEGKSGEGGGASQLLTRRVKTQEEEDKEEADYMSWLRGQAELQEEEQEDMKHLRDYWNDPALDDKERFLRDYVLNKGYRDEDEDDRQIPTYEQLVQDSEEEGETFLQRQDDFERSYNFRFEEPDAQQVKTYPRCIATSVRSKDERRKRKREEVKERKQKEKEQKRQQLKQLKNLKRNQILDKLQKLQELSGNPQLDFSQEDLDGDFDPHQHQQLMQKVFGEEFYGGQEEDKPQFEEQDLLEEPWNWDTWTGAEPDDEDEVEDGQGDEETCRAAGPHCDDLDFNMDADFDPEQQNSKKQQKKKKKKKNLEDLPLMGKKRRKSHFADVITKNKPVFDPQEKSFQQYLDEYYKLDYEDVIDDLPCRFRYRKVLPNDFGLSTDEILGADEKELNRWCSLKKTCMFRSDQEELSDLKSFQVKAQNHRKKKEILSSIYSQEDRPPGDLDPEVGRKRPDRLKTVEEQEKEEQDDVLVPKKKVKQEEEPQIPAQQDQDQVQDQDQDQDQEQDQNTDTRAARPRCSQKKLQRSGGGGVRIGGGLFSRVRLKAYGLNPKRLYFRQLGRKRNLQRKDLQKKDRQSKDLQSKDRQSKDLQRN